MGLPPVGQIRMNLRSLERPEIMIPCRLAGFNTMSVLIETSHIPANLPAVPEGMEWLSSPQPIGSISNWQVQFDAPLKDSRVSMVLLDAEDRIVGASHIQFRDGWPNERYRSMKGSLIGRGNFVPDASIFKNQGILQTGGPPRRFALVRKLSAQPSPIPPITVQEFMMPDEFPLEGRMETIRVWQQMTDDDSNVAVGGKPRTIAWYREGKLTLCELGEHAVARMIDLKISAKPRRPPQLVWQGTVLRFFCDQVPVDAGEAKTTMASIRLDRVEAPDFMELPYILSAYPSEVAEDEVVVLQGPRRKLVGLLSSEGRLVATEAPKMSGQRLSWEGRISPTKALCILPGSQQRVVLDWSEGAVKITEAVANEKLWFPAEPKPLNLMMNGNFSDLSLSKRRDWKMDLGAFMYIWPLGQNRAFGATKTGVVLYRMIPTPSPDTRR